MLLAPLPFRPSGLDRESHDNASHRALETARPIGSPRMVGGFPTSVSQVG